jgi:hypothetical protein
LTTVSTYIHDAPDPKDDSFEVTYNFRLFSNYEMLEENLTALEEIMAYNGQGIQVVVVEMPVADGLYYFFGNGQEDHQQFLSRIDTIAIANDVPFWQTTSLDMIPEDGWFDYSHVNFTGATVLSNWLGQQVSKAEDEGAIVVSSNQ